MGSPQHHPPGPDAAIKAPPTTGGVTITSPPKPTQNTAQQAAGNQAVQTALRQPEDFDPDHPYPPDPQAPPDDNPFAVVSHRDFEFCLSPADPTVFLVPPEASLEDVADRLLADETRTAQFDFVPVPDSGEQRRGVRLRQYENLRPEAYKLVIDALDKKIVEDTSWVVDKLSARIIDDNDESQLTQMTLRWSQRSIIKDAAGTQYFDRYLNALDHWNLTSFWGTTMTAYEWLFDEVPSLRELLQKAVTLRSSRSVGYTVKDRRPEFAKDDTIGRFFFAGRTFYSLPIKIVECVATEDSMEAAERRTRNTNSSQMRVVIPGGDGKFYGYTVEVVVRDKSPDQDPHGEYFWYYPGTVAIQHDEFRMDYPAGSAGAKESRRALLTAALPWASANNINPIANLDFEVLSTATLEERMTMINMVLNGDGKETESGTALIARIILTTPNSDFPAMERRMSTDGTIGRLHELTKDFPALAIVGKAFTYRSIQAMPPSAEELSHLETLQYGLDSDDYMHYALPEIHKVSSETLGADRWKPTDAPRIGAEPTRAGETPGRFEREVIRFYPTLLQSGGFWKLLGAVLHDEHLIGLPTTRDFLPTELIRIEVLGKHPEVRIVTALEAAGMLDITKGDLMEQVVKPIANAWMWGTAITRFGFGISGAIAGTTAIQAVKSFAWEAVLLGSMQVVDAYREELAETEAGRAFLAVYDIAMVVLMARDLYKVLSSGALVKLAQLSGRALMAVKDATRLGIERSMAEIEALNLAWKRLVEAGEVVPQAGGDAALRVPRSPEKFQQLWMAARAETFTARAVKSLTAAGESTTEVERLFEKLQNISKESAEMARAQKLLAERIGTLRGAALQNILNAFKNTLENARGLTNELGGWFQAAARSPDPIRYLAEVDKLVAKKGVAAASIEVLGRKAAAGTLDLEWLNSTGLTQRDISTLGADPRTPWSAYQKAAAATDDSSIFWARTSVRGASAEIAVERNARSVLPNHTIRGSQVPMGSSIIDFEVTAKGLGSRHGLEIKGWTRDTWNEALDVAKKRMKLGPGKSLTQAEQKIVKKLDGMVGQLKDAKGFTGNPPLLGVTTALPETETRILEELLRSEGLGDTTIIRIPEAQILDIGRTLRSAMGIP